MLNYLTLTNQDIFILGCLLILIALVGIVCLIMALFSTKDEKKKNNIKEKEKNKVKEVDMSVSLATNDIPEISKEAPNLEDLLNSVREEKIEKEEEKEEMLDIPKEEQEKKSSSIEDVLKLMNADLEKQKYENIDKYEEEQEENAVISYQELLDRKMALNNEREEVKEQTTSTESIKQSKFSNSEFISPIFGRVNKSLNKEDTEEQKNKQRTDDDFLSDLKNFRNNL